LQFIDSLQTKGKKVEKETEEKEEVVVKGKGLSEKEEKENKSSVFVRMYKKDYSYTEIRTDQGFWMYTYFYRRSHQR